MKRKRNLVETKLARVLKDLHLSYRQAGKIIGISHSTLYCIARYSQDVTLQHARQIEMGLLRYLDTTGIAYDRKMCLAENLFDDPHRRP